jgi:hypothetical protein
MNARQKAFLSLAKLFTELVRAVPEVDITLDQRDAAAKILHQRFTAIMEEYDKKRLAELSIHSGGKF